jgi:hypothetical protein
VSLPETIGRHVRMRLSDLKRILGRHINPNREVHLIFDCTCEQIDSSRVRVGAGKQTPTLCTCVHASTVSKQTIIVL